MVSTIITKKIHDGFPVLKMCALHVGSLNWVIKVSLTLAFLLIGNLHLLFESLRTQVNILTLPIIDLLAL